jgi:SAM-dependent methyltransferase
MVWTERKIRDRLAQLGEAYGEWTFDIPLAHGIWTRGNEGEPHTRLKRIFQIACDLSTKPLNACRVLDLGCLDGQFSIEFALAGAEVTGIEIREANIQKALFAKEVLDLDNLEFVHQDVRTISYPEYGKFDVILCSGILYHLNTPDVFTVIERMYEMSERLLIVDTHISLSPLDTVTHRGHTYYGKHWREYSDEDAELAKRTNLWASWGNPTSFMFTRPSLVNCLGQAGFSSVYECFNPPHLNFGQPGLEHKDRCTFVAINGHKRTLVTSPTANALSEKHPEGTLSYSPV